MITQYIRLAQASCNDSSGTAFGSRMHAFNFINVRCGNIRRELQLYSDGHTDFK